VLLLDAVIAVLKHRGRSHLADLLASSQMELFELEEDDGFGFSAGLSTHVQLTAPIAVYDQLKALSRGDRDSILEAVTECLDVGPSATSLIPVLDKKSLAAPRTHAETLLSEIQAQKALMTAVATGGPRMADVDDEYKTRRAQISAALAEVGLSDPVPFDSLWDWHAHWSKELDSYRSRREYLSKLFAPLIASVRGKPGTPAPPLFTPTTGWTAVDDGQLQLRALLGRARLVTQFQSVGLHCRELLITLGQTVYDSTRHPAADGQAVSATDAKRMLEAYISAELRGSSNEELRRHARAAFDLANALQHRRTATFRDAALCAEATASIINLVAIVSGRRDPPEDATL
jgi:hypothetical protein